MTDMSEAQKKRMEEAAKEYLLKFHGKYGGLALQIASEDYFEGYKAGLQDPSRSEALDKVLDIAAWLDDYTIHTRKCYDNRKSLDECLCGLNEVRERLRELRKV